MAAAKVAPYTAAEAFRFADIQNAILPIPHEVATGLRRNFLQSSLQPFRLGQQGFT